MNTELTLTQVSKIAIVSRDLLPSGTYVQTMEITLADGSYTTIKTFGVMDGSGEMKDLDVRNEIEVS